MSAIGQIERALNYEFEEAKRELLSEARAGRLPDRPRLTLEIAPQLVEELAREKQAAERSDDDWYYCSECGQKAERWS